MTEVQPHTLAAGRYLLVEPIGEGGMAMVYRAFDQRLQVWRAIKVLNPRFAASAKIKERFDFEAQTMALLEHPNIVRVYDVGSVGNVSYIVMELVRGGSLVDWLEQHGGMPAGLAMRVIDQVCHGVAAAHAKGVIHRDIKPHNVLVTVDGICRITDFGIARVGTDDSRTKTGSVMGTWGYMAPEQRSDAKNVDERADVYAIAATLFTLVANRIPMDLFAVDRDQTMLAGVPQELLGVLTKATEYHREDRFESVNALREAFAEVRHKLPADPPSTPPLVVRKQPPLGPPSPELVARSTPLVGEEFAGGQHGTLMPATTADGTPMGAIRISEDTVGAVPPKQGRSALPWIGAVVVLFFGLVLIVVAIGLAWPILQGGLGDWAPEVAEVIPAPEPEPEPAAVKGPQGDSGEAGVDTAEGDPESALVGQPDEPEPQVTPNKGKVDGAPERPVSTVAGGEGSQGEADGGSSAAQADPEPQAEPEIRRAPRPEPRPQPVARQCIQVKEATGITIGARAPFEARLCDEDGSPVTLWYRPAGSQTWQSVGMPLTLGAHRAVVPIDDRFVDGLDYYIQTTGASHGTRDNPKRVGVR